MLICYVSPVSLLAGIWSSVCTSSWSRLVQAYLVLSSLSFGLFVNIGADGFPVLDTVLLSHQAQLAACHAKLCGILVVHVHLVTLTHS